MFKNDFQELQRQIEPSDALIEQTKAKMQQALLEKKHKEKQFKKTIRLAYQATATAACFLFVAITGFFFNEVNNTAKLSHDSASFGSSNKGCIVNDMVTLQPETSHKKEKQPVSSPESNESQSTLEATPSHEEEAVGTTDCSNPEESATQKPSIKNGDIAPLPDDQLNQQTSGAKPDNEIQTATPSKSNTILSHLTPGIHANSVRLNNGSLNFVTPEYSLKLPSFSLPQNKIVTWTQEQYFQYLECDPLPIDIPKDLQPIYLDSDSKIRVSVNKDGSIGNDGITFTFGKVVNEKEKIDEKTTEKATEKSKITEKNNNPIQRQLKITTAKGTIPKLDLIFLFDKENASEIKEVPVNVGYQKKEMDKQKYDVYCAQFLYNNVGYYIESQCLTQEEFIQILLSIIK